MRLIPAAAVTDCVRRLCLAANRRLPPEAEAALRDGSLHVFDTSTFTVDGQTLTTYMADVDTDADNTGDTEAISDGYFHESEFRSAPYFDLQIDGITLLDVNYG